MKADEFLKCFTIFVAIVLHSAILCAGNGDPPLTASPSNPSNPSTTVSELNASGGVSAHRPKPSDSLSIITDPLELKDLEEQRAEKDDAAATRSLNEVYGASAYASNPYEHRPLAAPEQTRTGDKSKDAPKSRALPDGSVSEQKSRDFPFDSPSQSSSDPYYQRPDQSRPSGGSSFGGPTSFAPPPPPPLNGHHLSNADYLKPQPPASSYSSSGHLSQINDINRPASPSQVGQYGSTLTPQVSSMGSAQPHHLQSSSGVGYQQGKPTAVSAEAAAYRPPIGSAETNTYGVYGDPTQPMQSPLPPQTTPTSPTAPHYANSAPQNNNMSRPPPPAPPAPPRLKYSQWTPRQCVYYLILVI